MCWMESGEGSIRYLGLELELDETEPAGAGEES
jgi:hypothetical protein